MGIGDQWEQIKKVATMLRHPTTGAPDQELEGFEGAALVRQYPIGSTSKSFKMTVGASGKPTATPVPFEFITNCNAKEVIISPVALPASGTSGTPLGFIFGANANVNTEAAILTQMEGLAATLGTTDALQWTNVWWINSEQGVDFSKAFVRAEAGTLIQTISFMNLAAAAASMGGALGQ